MQRAKCKEKGRYAPNLNIVMGTGETRHSLCTYHFELCTYTERMYYNGRNQNQFQFYI